MFERVKVGNEALQRTTFKVTVFRSSKTKQVLFLEAGKDFVDTLFSFLLLPVGTILHLLNEGIQIKPFGGISSIFESLDPSILLVDKQELTQARPSNVGCTCGSSAGLQVHQDLVAANLLLSPLQKQGVLKEVYFRCSSVNHRHYGSCCGSTLSSTEGASCETCKSEGHPKYTYSSGPYSVQLRHQFEAQVNRPKGFVKEVLKFIVTDKLEITPSTMIASMSVLQKLGVAFVDEPEGTETAVSVAQILQLLHSALTSNTCLNDVFGPEKIDTGSCSISIKVNARWFMNPMIVAKVMVR